MFNFKKKSTIKKSKYQLFKFINYLYLIKVAVLNYEKVSIFFTDLRCFFKQGTNARKYKGSRRGYLELLFEHLDQLTLLWDVESIELKTYQGLRKFCRSTAYRNSITEMLESMHHYDSVLYDMAIEASKQKHAHMKHLIHELESFESHYGVKQFLNHLKGRMSPHNPS